jgi:hypothetical protein
VVSPFPRILSRPLLLATEASIRPREAGIVGPFRRVALVTAIDHPVCLFLCRLRPVDSPHMAIKRCIAISSAAARRNAV